MDLGTLQMKRAGILNLQVSDPNGRAIKECSITFPGLGDDETPMPLEKSGFWFSIPSPGSVKVRVGASGHLYKERFVNIPSGTALDIPIVLEPIPHLKRWF